MVANAGVEKLLSSMRSPGLGKILKKGTFRHTFLGQEAHSDLLRERRYLCDQFWGFGGSFRIGLNQC